MYRFNLPKFEPMNLGVNDALKSIEDLDITRTADVLDWMKAQAAETDAKFKYERRRNYLVNGVFLLIALASLTHDIVSNHVWTQTDTTSSTQSKMEYGQTNSSGSQSGRQTVDDSAVVALRVRLDSLESENLKMKALIERLKKKQK